MSPTIVEGAPARELPDVQAGVLPARYGRQMQDELMAHLRGLLEPGVAILDVGSGRFPTIAPEDRPPGCRYVGLDVSGEELAAAAAGAYDEQLVHDVGRPLGRDGEFDLALSWQVLEHVRPLGAALENIRASLRPGGTLLAHLTGSFAAFAVLGRLMPHSLRVRALTRLAGHEDEEKFPLRLDRCHQRTLERMLEPWSRVRIVPFYRGAIYFQFWRPLLRTYLLYETAIARRPVRDLATHYLIVAQR